MPDPLNCPPLSPRQVHLEGFFSEAFPALTTGAFLTGVALALGAGPVALSLLAGLPFLAQLGQLVAPVIEPMARSRRAYVIPALMLARVLWLLPIALVFLGTGGNGPLALAMVAMFTMAFVNHIGQNGWQSWLADIVPPERRPKVFAARHWAAALSTLIWCPIAAFMLDRLHGTPNERWGYVVLGSVAVTSGLIGARVLSGYPDAPTTREPISALPGRVRALMRLPEYRRVLSTFMLWNLSWGLPLPFWDLYRLQHLKMGFFLISVHATIGIATRLLINRYWAMIITRVGSQKVLVACGFGVALVPVNWMLASADNYFFVWFDAVYSAVVWTGFAQAQFIQPMNVIPEHDRSLGLGLLNFSNGASIFVAGLVGGVFLHFVGTDTLYGLFTLFSVSALGRALTSTLAWRRFAREATVRGAFAMTRDVVLGRGPVEPRGDTWPPP